MHHRPHTGTGLYGHVSRQGKGKNGKAVSVHAKKAHIGVAEVQFSSFLTLKLAGGEWLMSCRSCFTIVKELE
jgi:hypothetical protein